MHAHQHKCRVYTRTYLDACTYVCLYMYVCRGVFQHQKWCLAVWRNWWMRKGNEKEINLSVLNACTLLLLLLLYLPNLRLNHTNNNAIANSAPTRAIVAVTTTTAFSLTAALVSDLVCLFQSSSHPFARMQNAFNHFICYCVLCFIHSRLHQHQHLQLCLRFVLPNSKIFYLLCTYDPHAGTAILSPIGLSESDTSVCCCCCCLLVALSAAFPSPPRRMLWKSVLCACVCVVFCLFANGWLLRMSLQLSPSLLAFSSPDRRWVQLLRRRCMQWWIVSLAPCVCVCAFTWAVAKSSSYTGSKLLVIDFKSSVIQSGV